LKLCHINPAGHLRVQKLACDRKRSHDGDALQPDHLALVAHLEHAAVDVRHRFETLALLVLRAADAEFASHHLEVYLLDGSGHQWSSGRRCSRASSRALAASTFSSRRLLSFRACASCWRRSRLSLRSRCVNSTNWPILSSSAFRSASMSGNYSLEKLGRSTDK